LIIGYLLANHFHCSCRLLKNCNQKLRNNLHVYLIVQRRAPKTTQTCNPKNCPLYQETHKKDIFCVLYACVYVCVCVWTLHFRCSGKHFVNAPTSNCVYFVFVFSFSVFLVTYLPNTLSPKILHIMLIIVSFCVCVCVWVFVCAFYFLLSALMKLSAGSAFPLFPLLIPQHLLCFQLCVCFYHCGTCKAYHRSYSTPRIFSGHYAVFPTISMTKLSKFHFVKYIYFWNYLNTNNQRKYLFATTELLGCRN